MTSNRNPLFQLKSIWNVSNSNSTVLIEDSWQSPADPLWLSLMKRILNGTICYVISFSRKPYYLTSLSHLQLFHISLDLASLNDVDEFINHLVNQISQDHKTYAIFIENVELLVWKYNEGGVVHLVKQLSKHNPRASSIYLHVNSGALLEHQSNVLRSRATHIVRPINHCHSPLNSQLTNQYCQRVKFSEQPDILSDIFEPQKCFADVWFNSDCELVNICEVKSSTSVDENKKSTKHNTDEDTEKTISSLTTFNLTLSEKEKLERSHQKELPFLKISHEQTSSIHYVGDEYDDFDDDDPDDDLDI